MYYYLILLFITNTYSISYYPTNTSQVFALNDQCGGKGFSIITYFGENNTNLCAGSAVCTYLNSYYSFCKMPNDTTIYIGLYDKCIDNTIFICAPKLTCVDYICSIYKTSKPLSPYILAIIGAGIVSAFTCLTYTIIMIIGRLVICEKIKLKILNK